MASYYGGQGGAVWLAGDVGMIATRPLTPTLWEICRVYVMPSCHGSGLGAALLTHAEGHARAHGATEFELWTDTRFTRAHRFYEKHGYRKQPGTKELHDLGRSVEFRYRKLLNYGAARGVRP